MQFVCQPMLGIAAVTENSGVQPAMASDAANDDAASDWSDTNQSAATRASQSSGHHVNKPHGDSTFHNSRICHACRSSIFKHIEEQLRFETSTFRDTTSAYDGRS